MDISEAIEASGLKICRCRQLIQLIKVNECWRSRSFLVLVFFSGFVCIILLLGPDISWALTEPLVLWFA